jgi:hypothetical protein
MQQNHRLIRAVTSLIVLCVAGALLCACPNSGNRSKGVYMLLDTSGTYAVELKKSQSILNYLLGTLNSGDTLAVGRIDTGSYSEKDIIAKVTFDNRPSIANNQKRAFQKKIDDFIAQTRTSSYTDISGGILQAIEYLNESNVHHKFVLLFSDLHEDLAKGYVRDVPFQLSGFDVVALNVTKLNDDIRDPKNYLDRVAQWRSKTESAGGKWRVINDLERLDSLLLK